MLRTTYAADADGEPQPTVHDDLTPGWSTHDLSGLSEHSRRLRLEVLAQREFSAPFDLSADAPLRMTLVRTGADEHVMLLVAHHIAWDDGSWQVFFADLTRAYTGEPLGAAERRYLRAVADAADDDLDYWRTVMANPPEPLELPGPNGSAIPTNFALAAHHAATARRDRRPGDRGGQGHPVPRRTWCCWPRSAR